MNRVPPHESVSPLGIIIPDPDQGTPYLHIQFLFPSTAIMVWEPFEDGEPGGHNLIGFCRRWALWKESEEPFLAAEDPRFGHDLMIPRSAIDNLACISIQYHRKEDVRAGVRGRSLAVPGGPGMRQLADGSIEISVPR